MQLHYIIFSDQAVMQAAVDKAREVGSVFFGDSLPNSDATEYRTTLLGNGMDQEYLVTFTRLPKPEVVPT